MQARWYEIRIQGTLSSNWRDWFEGMEIRQEGEEQTVLAGWVADQAALHGLLARVLNLNLVLLSVNPAEPPAAQHKTEGE